ncbi:MAG TPA: HAD family hydrolase, partial [Myxococcota bacterium]|nr:HAD family hydrolase [Myxococcota bacterium]
MTPGPIEAVLFDKDGTLVDLLATWLPTYRAATDRLAEAAGDPSLSDRLMIAGGWRPRDGRLAPGSPLSCATNDDIIALWSNDPQVAALGDVHAMVRETFLTEAVRNSQPIVPLRPMLTALRDLGLRLGIATMDSTAAATAGMLHLGVADMFDLILGFDAGFGAKPAPGMVHAFCAAVDAPPERVAMVGDARKDLDTGRNAGVGLVVAVLTGAADRAELAPHADVVLDSVGGLPDL